MNQPRNALKMVMTMDNKIDLLIRIADNVQKDLFHHMDVDHEVAQRIAYMEDSE